EPGTSSRGRGADPPVPAGEAPRGSGFPSRSTCAPGPRVGTAGITRTPDHTKEMQVSDQPQAALERSALEAKDRGELMTIATAMGGKPGSRAKKADIIDLIFELAGVTPADAEPEAPAETE